MTTKTTTNMCFIIYLLVYWITWSTMYVYGFIDILHNSFFSKCVFVFLFYSIGLLLLANERMFNKKISFENNYACTTLFNHPINNYDIIHISEIHTHHLKFYETLFITHLKPIVFTWSLFFRLNLSLFEIFRQISLIYFFFRLWWSFYELYNFLFSIQFGIVIEKISFYLFFFLGMLSVQHTYIYNEHAKFFVLNFVYLHFYIYFEPKPKKKSTKKFSNKKNENIEMKQTKKIAKINWNKKQENWRQIPCKMYRYGWILVENYKKWRKKT